MFFSVKDSDKPHAVALARDFLNLGFSICSTTGTAKLLQANGIEVQFVNKMAEGRPNCVDMIKNGEIHLVINTPKGMIPRNDENAIRAAAYANNVCIMTTITGARAAINGIRAMKAKLVDVRALQLYKGSVVPM